MISGTVPVLLIAVVGHTFLSLVATTGLEPARTCLKGRALDRFAFVATWYPTSDSNREKTQGLSLPTLPFV